MYAVRRRKDVPIEAKLTLTVDEVSALTGFGVNTIRLAIKNKKLIAKTPEEGNRRLLIPRTSVEAWVNGMPERL